MEFFLSLFFVTGGISIELSEKRFSSISDILFKISFVRVTLITCSTSISSIYYIVLRIVFPLKLHYFFTIFHYFVGDIPAIFLKLQTISIKQKILHSHDYKAFLISPRLFCSVYYHDLFK